MTREQGSGETGSLFTALFAALATGAAIFSWLEALSFDPCNTILTHGGAGCIEPGLSGIIIGAVCAAFGLTIASGAVRAPARADVSKMDRALLGWFGLMFAVTGGAIAFAQWTVGTGL
ncbi:hypothetical protein [Erythrobacter sp. MTPC3]|uniref:hypothetical protein n=1 Tax=Erythrobacter sp. MTPC3 TaxID=3056564 RepID=UPI0036F27F78